MFHASESFQFIFSQVNLKELLWLITFTIYSCLKQDIFPYYLEGI